MVPPALLWRLEQEDQRLKTHDGRWIDIQRLRLLESFVDHDHTLPSAPRPVDDREAPDWNGPEMGKTRQWNHRWRGVET
mgnify:CR=1 FL=1